MKAPRIYEGFAFPLKNNVSRNHECDIQRAIPRGRMSLLFRRRKTNVPLKVIMQRKMYRFACEYGAGF